MADRIMRVVILGDDRAYQQSLTRSTASTAKFERQIASTNLRTQALGQTLRGALSTTGGGGGFLFGSGAFVGTALLTAGLVKSIDAASDLNETISKSRQVFGAASVEVERFGDSAASAIGVSKQQAVEAAATFGNLFRTVGLAGQENARFSSSLVKLAADLASFNNVNPEDALLALRSGLIGEAEPLRRFGVLLSEARVGQVALAESGKKTTKELTDQEKVLARYQIILKDTAAAQGDFARTSDGLANQTRTLKANFSDLAANLGTTFLPAVNASIGGINDLFETGTLVSKVEQQIRDSINEANISMTTALPILEAYRAGLAGINGEGDALVKTLDQIINKRLEAEHRIADAARGEGRTAESVFQSNIDVDATERERREAAIRNARQAQAAIDRITRAAAQQSLNQQLADSQKRAKHLTDLIRKDADNVKLQQRLRAELDKQASLRRQIAAEAQSAAEADKRAAQEAKKTAETIARLRRQEAAERRKAEQFKALGLTAEGQRRTPGSGALLQRARSLQDQVRGTTLDTAKTRSQLRNIVSVLTKNFKTAGRDVRAAILEMLNAISGALDEGTKGQGPLTKTSGLNTLKITQDLGLTPEQERLLRARLSSFNTGGVRLAGADKTGTTQGGFSGGQNVNVTVNNTVELDGEVVAKNTTKHQQKGNRRNPRQKRGPNRKN